MDYRVRNCGLLAAGLWLCAVIAAVPSIVGAQPDERARIEVPLFEGGAGLDFFFLTAREFEKQRPNVHVDLYGDPRIADKVRVRILEGTFPEVSNAGLNWWSVIRNGEVLPLDE